MKLEHYFKLETELPKIKWRLVIVNLAAVYFLFIGDQEIGISLLAGVWTTKGE